MWHSQHKWSVMIVGPIQNLKHTRTRVCDFIVDVIVTSVCHKTRSLDKRAFVECGKKHLNYLKKMIPLCDIKY